MLTQTLASLDLTADILAPLITNSARENVQVTSSNQNAMPCRGVIRERIALNVSPESDTTVTLGNKEKSNTRCHFHAKDFTEERVAKRVKTEVKVEDDEEIDVERVDEADPMWRPW